MKQSNVPGPDSARLKQAAQVDQRTRQPSVVDSQSLLAGARELIIQHGMERYRLLLTAQNKLILIK